MREAGIFNKDATLIPFVLSALETGSRHPIAAAFAVFADNTLVAEQVHHEVGFGVRGRIGLTI
ncbi:hypothetical protein P4S55_25115 [Shewanella sp. PP-Sp27a-2]